MLSLTSSILIFFLLSSPFVAARPRRAKHTKVAHRALPAGWAFQGCYNDPSSARILPFQVYRGPNNTPSSCVSQCRQAGFSFAGVEFGVECWCGNSLPNSSTNVCTMPCSGDSTQTCGGPNRIGVYRPSQSTSRWSNIGCFRDQDIRTLQGLYFRNTSGMTPEACQANCAEYTFAGLEYGVECFCSNSLRAKVPSASCNTPCSGDGSRMCGGPWSISIFQSNGTGSTTTLSPPPPSTASASVVSASSTTTFTPSTVTMSSNAATSSSLNGGSGGRGGGSGSNWWTSNGLNQGKLIVAHVIVGNTYSYTSDKWTSDIKVAQAQGVDAFALNFGYDSWQAGHMQAAYDAASNLGTGFKMFLSFDMTVLSCSDDSVIRSNIVKFANHPAQLRDSSGAMWVSTFDGGGCRNNDQWNNVIKNNGVPVHFVPAFFNDLTNTQLKQIFPVVNGDFLWWGGWPKGDSDIDWSEDSYRLSRNGINRSGGDTYMAAVSPGFFVHYSGRNEIWRPDGHLYASRWELLFQQRNLVDAVEIVTWNDYGESTYIGPIGQDQPGSQGWVDNFDHEAFLEMTGYYATAFKTGVYPAITFDKIFIWGRPHPHDANANDGVGKPNNYQWTEDKLWIVLFSTGTGSLTVTQGSSSTKNQIQAGINKLSMNLASAPSVLAQLTRNGAQVFSQTFPISYTTNPSMYNYNVNAGHGP